MIDIAKGARRATLAIIILYPRSASGIIVVEDFESRGQKFANRRFFQAFVLETKKP